MGMGWRETGNRKELYREKCPTGQGYIVTYGIEEESDYAPEPRYDDTVKECRCNSDIYKECTCYSKR